MELEQELLRALELAAWDPNHALGRVEAWPAGAARPSPPATPEQVQASQRRLGFSLPVPLRQVVMQVANGGFGPGYGLLGLESGATDDKGRTAVTPTCSGRRGMGSRTGGGRSGCCQSATGAARPIPA
jgi:hypothetical protein